MRTLVLGGTVSESSLCLLLIGAYPPTSVPAPVLGPPGCTTSRAGTRPCPLAGWHQPLAFSARVYNCSPVGMITEICRHLANSHIEAFLSLFEMFLLFILPIP